MKKGLKIALSIILTICILTAAVPSAVYYCRGNIKSVSLPDNFSQSLKNDCFDNESDVRIMSSNLLVHYKSWGGTPVKPRAKQYINLIDNYKPDVIDGWFCCINNNLPKGYKLLNSFTNGAFVRMTALIYNSDTLELIDCKSVAYEQKDNPRLRRIAWAVFEVKETGKRFAVTSTHLDLIREGQEEELEAVMTSQASELSDFITSLESEYSCPVIAVGDYNTMEDTPYTKAVDIPKIYNSLAERYTDAKFSAENKVCGDSQDWDYPSYDHIFISGNARSDTFALLSYNYLSDMSDHYPIFADISIN